MTQLQTYLQVSIPERPKLLGLVLKPYSLGHQNIIDRLGIEFLKGCDSNKPEDIAQYVHDFFLTVLICSMTYEENLEAFNEDTITVRHCVLGFEFYRKQSFTTFLKRWNKALEKGLNGKKVNVLRGLSIFKEYLENAFVCPDHVPGKNAKESIHSGASWQQSLYTVLVKELNYTPSQAYNLPLAQAFFEWCKYAENNGLIEIVSDEEKAMVEELRKASHGI